MSSRLTAPQKDSSPIIAQYESTSPTNPGGKRVGGQFRSLTGRHALPAELAEIVETYGALSPASPLGRG